MKNTQLVQIDSEGGVYTVELARDDVKKARQLLNKAQKSGEWPDEVNDILDRAKKVKLAGIISTHGDGWGWYKDEG